VSEQELEVTETELDETQNPAAESAEGSEVESAAPDSEGDADFDDDAETDDDTDAEDAETDADDVTGEDAEEGAEGTDVLAAAAAQATDPAEEFKSKLRRQEGDWYVIHSYAGYENRVKANL
jgi:transcription termination/antitermination protein NusG